MWSPPSNWQHWITSVAGARFEEINLIGTADDIIEKIETLRDTGAIHLSGLLFPANSVEEMKDQMQRFAEAVIPKVQK